MNKIRNKAYLVAFGKNLRRIRKGKALTMMQLAFEADIEYSQIAKIESGQINTTISTVYSIASALEVSTEELFSFKFNKGVCK